MARPKDIGTAAETAVVKALRLNGFPHAERRALAGSYDLGDITGTPGICWEVKGGAAAKDASDGQIEKWLAETETERLNSRSDIGVLVVQRRGIGPKNADRWWAIFPLWLLDSLAKDLHVVSLNTWHIPVRMTLGNLCTLLRDAGYGQPLEEAA
ncbi:hypothetical protein AB0G15_05565 [Streptosporangium sp. NPDC023825]|uniref:hypothetical protein n=1 Tax=Streptosporangium sp. NPDC023825 TaxID=3154909 RepID=UPI003412EF00